MMDQQIDHAGDLTSYAHRYGTDKGGEHSYLGFYADVLGPWRDRPIRILEIGIGGYSDRSAGGGSLRMWRDFFSQAHIVGMDFFDKSGLSIDGVTIVRGDQSSEESLRELHNSHGPFDVVIDDGSHLCSHVETTFRVLFPLLAPNGVYIIEDLQTSYWPRYGGKYRPRTSSGTSMAMLKRLVDGLNHQEFRLPRYRPSATDRSVVELRFRHNIASIHKGDNSEPSHRNAAHPRPLGEWLRHEGVVYGLGGHVRKLLWKTGLMSENTQT